MHNCPICGELTEGSYSEGGIHFNICVKCYKERYQEKHQKEKQGKQLNLSIPDSEQEEVKTVRKFTLRGQEKS